MAMLLHSGGGGRLLGTGKKDGSLEERAAQAALGLSVRHGGAAGRRASHGPAGGAPLSRRNSMRVMSSGQSITRTDSITRTASLRRLNSGQAAPSSVWVPGSGAGGEPEGVPGPPGSCLGGTTVVLGASSKVQDYFRLQVSRSGESVDGGVLRVVTVARSSLAEALSERRLTLVVDAASGLIKDVDLAVRPKMCS
jgi:hypothetical protein